MARWGSIVVKLRSSCERCPRLKMTMEMLTENYLRGHQRHILVLPLSALSPTFDEASVRELSVVLFPDEGLPTRPIRGSRGMDGMREVLLQIIERDKLRLANNR